MAGIAVAGLAIASCGSDVRRERAYRTTELAARALDLVEQTSGREEIAEVDRARASAREWVDRAHESLGHWMNNQSRSLPFETVVPCMARALGSLRERLAEHRRPIPDSLRQAEALARTATDARCAVRRSRVLTDEQAEREEGEER